MEDCSLTVTVGDESADVLSGGGDDPRTPVLSVAACDWETNDLPVDDCALSVDGVVTCSVYDCALSVDGDVTCLVYDCALSVDSDVTCSIYGCALSVDRDVTCLVYDCALSVDGDVTCSVYDCALSVDRDVTCLVNDCVLSVDGDVTYSEYDCVLSVDGGVACSVDDCSWSVDEDVVPSADDSNWSVDEGDVGDSRVSSVDWSINVDAAVSSSVHRQTQKNHLCIFSIIRIDVLFGEKLILKLWCVISNFKMEENFLQQNFSSEKNW